MSLTEEVDQNWREFSLNFGRRKSCNFLLILDTNNFLLRDSLRQLISFAELPVVLSPFLDSPMEGSVNNAQELELDLEFVWREKLDFVRVFF